MNPVFDHFLENIITREELRRAKTYARSATQGELNEDEVNDWMNGMKTGF